MESIAELFISVLFLLAILIPFYLIGTITEHRHYKSIKRRETQLITLPATNLKRPPKGVQIRSTQLAKGSAVIALDYFKQFLAILRNLVGGRIRSYETLLDRARREAILRLKESCSDADLIINLRLETSSIGKSSSRKKQIGSVEVLAYGTALYFKK
jgi:uncharacterized protein YbjQ (UPF0145 family)